MKQFLDPFGNNPMAIPYTIDIAKCVVNGIFALAGWNGGKSESAINEPKTF
jgi:hypothetical protein